MIPSDMIQTEKENHSLAEQLHHISGQLDELIRLIRDSTAFRTDKLPDEPAPSNNEVMTVKEAAALLRISLPKMYCWHNEPTLVKKKHYFQSTMQPLCIS